MNKKIAFAAALALFVVGIRAPSASAACNPPKFASTYNPATAASVYWTTTVTDPSATLAGRIWSGGTDYTGTCNDGQQTFFYFGLAPGTIGLSLSLGNACVPPGLCPSGNLNAKAWVFAPGGAQQETGARQALETPAGGVNFDFSDTAVTMVNPPRPRALTHANSGANTNVLMAAEPIPGDAASVSTVTGCNIRSARSATHPGPLATSYPTLLMTTPVTGGMCASASVPVDCTLPPTMWLVFQIVTSAGPDAYVGPALQVACNPALAEPKNRITPKKHAVSVRH